MRNSASAWTRSSRRKAVDFEIIVVDNGSTDGSAQTIEREYAGRVELLRNSENRGFGAAHNQAIARSHGRYVILTNPDCAILETGGLRKMTRFMDENPDAGMPGLRVVNPDGSLQFSARRFPSMLAGIFRHTALGKLFPNNRFVRAYLMTDWKHDRISDVGWLSGSALMARRLTFEQIGLLDERFFMYREDVDWCKRAHKGGWRVVYFPETSVSHRIGASSDQNPIPMIKQHHRSMLCYFLKDNARGPKYLLTPAVMLALWIRARSLERRVKAIDD